MSANFMQLPLEVQEEILWKLDCRSFLKASRVCKLWLSLCARIARRRYFKTIPPECICEVQTSSIEDTWMAALKNHILERCLISNIFDPKIISPLNIKKNINICFASYGSFVFMGTNAGEILVNEVNETRFESRAFLNCDEAASVRQILVMPAEQVLIAVTPRCMTCWSLPAPSSSGEEFNMKKLHHVFEKYTGPIDYHKEMSVDGRFLSLLCNPYEVLVFTVHHETDGGFVFLRVLDQYLCQTPVRNTSVGRKAVTILLTSGEVILWNLITQDSYLTVPYQEIQYLNPVFILRGRIFCSTIISSQMLGYWHMDRGASYWLIGWPDTDLIRCRDLGTMYSADTGMEDVLCVCLKQRLLACGTKNGKILLYYLSDAFFSFEDTDDYEYEKNNKCIRTEFARVPDLTIRTAERPIKDISVEFNESTINIYTWPYMSPDVGSNGVFQCIVLKEGNWVTEEDYARL